MPFVEKSIGRDGESCDCYSRHGRGSVNYANWQIITRAINIFIWTFYATLHDVDDITFLFASNRELYRYS